MNSSLSYYGPVTVCGSADKSLSNIMAEVVHGLLDYNLKIKLKVECEALDAKNKPIQSEIRKTSESISVGSALELKLNIDELQELYSMCT